LAVKENQIAAALRPRTEFLEMVGALGRPHRQLAEAVAAAQKNDRAFQNSLASFGATARSLAAIRAQFEEINAPFVNAFAEVRRQADVLHEACRVALHGAQDRQLQLDFSRSISAWQWSTTAVTDAIRKAAIDREEIRPRLTLPGGIFVDFFRETHERLRVADSQRLKLPLRASIALAQDQLLGISGTLSGLITLPSDVAERIDDLSLRAPWAQQDKLLEAGYDGDENDAAQIVAASPTAAIVTLAREVLDLITLCNEASKTSIGHEIFRPTTRLMSVFAQLPWLVATDRRGIGDVVDCFYFAFYESPGKDKLRFMVNQGGPLENDDCDLIWCIKHLRNKWTRHDADHGDEKPIQKSWKELAAKFRWLGLAEHPTDEKQFRQLQQQLLTEAKAFLQEIIRRLKLLPP
jgi:hypothetical protein